MLQLFSHILVWARFCGPLRDIWYQCGVEVSNSLSLPTNEYRELRKHLLQTLCDLSGDSTSGEVNSTDSNSRPILPPSQNRPHSPQIRPKFQHDILRFSSNPSSHLPSTSHAQNPQLPQNPPHFLKLLSLLPEQLYHLRWILLIQIRTMHSGQSIVLNKKQAQSFQAPKIPC